jgi:hypothetical protein
MGIADFRFPIVGAENRNSKIETRPHWVAAVCFPSFEFPVSSFEYRQSTISNQREAILAGFSPNCMQEILEVSLRAGQDAFSLGKIAKAQFQQLA